jgi:ubiquinone/menaquinone biosynthesis C-methylase UbiE
MSEPLNDIQRAAREQFSRQSHRYAKGHILSNIDDVAEAAKLMDLPPGGRVLDVATGAGYTGLYFARHGFRVTLADLSASMIERALAGAKAEGLEVESCQHTAEKFPHSDGSFDLVTCRVAAHHFSSPELFVRETARVLVPGGYFLLIDGSVEDGQPVAEEWIHQVEKFRDPSHHRFLTPNAWKEICESAALRVIHCSLQPFKQPDLDWYFETAATSEPNREIVRRLIEDCPEEAKRLFQVGSEEGKIVWWWRRLCLIARRPA